jgi:peptidyl-prolyl cis-trans isomerase SurA
VHARRRSRALLAALAVPLAAAALAGCRTSPSVAAYVGDGQISVDGLQSAMAGRQASDKAVAAYANAHRTDFTRFVLGTLVDQRVYDAAAQRYGVQVSDGAVRQRLGELIAAQGSDPATIYRQAAAQGVTQQDLLAQVRELVIAERVAAAAGKAGGLSEAALRTRYAQEQDKLAQTQLGYITVADQATADAVKAQLTGHPSRYAAVAAQHPSQATLPALQLVSSAQIPPQLAQGVAAAKPNTAFSVPVPQVGGIVVCFVGARVVPPFEQARATLVQEAQSAVDQAGVKLVEDVRTGLHVTVNPRYGVLKNGRLTTPSGGVVDILTPGSGTASAPSGR